MLDPLAGPMFKPALDLLDWALASFVDPDGPLANPDHAHLAAARIGCLWTNVANSRHGRKIAGQAEFQPPGGTIGKWARARAQAQICGWFGGGLDFLLTFDAVYAAEASDRAFCALVEHEFYHCGQARDEFGQPRFVKDTGMPVFCMRGHDVEGFVGVAKRYGPVEAGVAELVSAATAAPQFADSEISMICGTCGR